jgi:hypothetical protein
MAQFRDDSLRGGRNGYRRPKSGITAVVILALALIGGGVLLVAAVGAALWLLRSEVREEQFPRVESIEDAPRPADPPDR